MGEFNTLSRNNEKVGISMTCSCNEQSTTSEKQLMRHCSPIALVISYVFGNASAVNAPCSLRLEASASRRSSHKIKIYQLGRVDPAPNNIVKCIYIYTHVCVFVRVQYTYLYIYIFTYSSNVN